MKKTVLLLYLLIPISTIAQRKLHYAFNRLAIYDYYEAKKCFYQSLNKNEAIAHFGLSELYYREANPFHQNDSANVHIQQCEFAYQTLNLKDKTKANTFGVNDTTINRQKEKISLQAFRQAVSKNSVSDYTYFISNYPYAVNLTIEAKKTMHALAFEQLSQINNSLAYKQFIDQYPDAQEISRAKAQYEELLFLEITTNATLESYQSYLQNYSDGAFKGVAEDSIYTISTQDASVQSLYSFIQQNRKNRNLPKAWKRIYQLYMTDYTNERFEAFTKQFPEYPFMDELKIDRQLSETFLFPYRRGNLWGYINESGKWIIEPAYESAEMFQDGYAMVESNEKIFFINKKGNAISDKKYDDAEPFENGYALVMNDNLWGMINRNGFEVIPCQYSDLRYIQDGRILFEKNNLFGYMDDEFNVMIKPQFDEAYDFSNGVAIILKDDAYGLIDKSGNELIEATYDQLITTPYPVVFGRLDEE